MTVSVAIVKLVDALPAVVADPPEDWSHRKTTIFPMNSCPIKLSAGACRPEHARCMKISAAFRAVSHLTEHEPVPPN